MGRIAKEESLRRREEIINVAANLYQRMPFKDINIKEIGNNISFTRTAIYTYFDNKEEIYLALLEREYLEWEADLRALLNGTQLTTTTFATAIAQSLAKRTTLLKILSVDMNAIDASVPREALISFKATYGEALTLMKALLKKHFPARTEAANQQFVFAFFPFLYGVYPYTTVTTKQRLAMTAAKTPYVYMSSEEMIENCILQLLKG